MSYYGKNDWRFRSNGLSKSSSQPNYLIPHELNKYNWGDNWIIKIEEVEMEMDAVKIELIWIKLNI